MVTIIYNLKILPEPKEPHYDNKKAMQTIPIRMTLIRKNTVRDAVGGGFEPPRGS
jgi:hypothetical protein